MFPRKEHENHPRSRNSHLEACFTDLGDANFAMRRRRRVARHRRIARRRRQVTLQNILLLPPPPLLRRLGSQPRLNHHLQQRLHDGSTISQTQRTGAKPQQLNTPLPATKTQLSPLTKSSIHHWQWIPPHVSPDSPPGLLKSLQRRVTHITSSLHEIYTTHHINHAKTKSSEGTALSLNRSVVVLPTLSVVK